MNQPFAYLLVLVFGVVFAFVITQLAMLATTVYLHRYLAHGGIELRPEVRAASRIIVWVTTALKPRQWACVHRYHHAAEDSSDDPHSPANFGGGRRGAWYVFWRNGPLYTQATRDQRLAEKYGDLTSDRWDRWLFDRGEMGLVLGVSVACAAMAVVGYLLVGGWRGITAGIVAGLVAVGLHTAYYLLAGGAINGFGHASPVRRPGIAHATNLPVIAWLTFGEGWHANHHTAQNSPRLGRDRQVDLGWLAIRGLCHLRLARVTTRGAAGLLRLQDAPRL